MLLRLIVTLTLFLTLLPSVAASQPSQRVTEIWLANLHHIALNAGEPQENYFPVDKDIIPVDRNGSFSFNTGDIVGYDVMILANTNVSDPKDVIVGLIAIPDGDNVHLFRSNLNKLNKNLDLGMITVSNGMGQTRKTLDQAAKSFDGAELPLGALLALARIDDTAKTVINAYVNYNQEQERLVGTQINTVLGFTGLDSDSWTDVPADSISGYNLNFRTNSGTSVDHWLFPPEDIQYQETMHGPNNPIKMGVSDDGAPTFSYVVYGFSGNAPPKGYWTVREGTAEGDVVAEADFALLGCIDSSGFPILMPSIRPNVNEDGIITSFNTKWYSMRNGNLEEISSAQALELVIQDYHFSTNVKDPDVEYDNYTFQGQIIGNTPVPWEISMDDVTGEDRMLKVNVAIYGASFECYFRSDPDPDSESQVHQPFSHSGRNVIVTSQQQILSNQSQNNDVVVSGRINQGVVLPGVKMLLLDDQE